MEYVYNKGQLVVFIDGEGEHELGIVADFILLAEVYLVRLFSVIEQKTRIRIDEDFCN